MSVTKGREIAQEWLGILRDRADDVFRDFGERAYAAFWEEIRDAFSRVEAKLTTELRGIPVRLNDVQRRQREGISFRNALLAEIGLYGAMRRKTVTYDVDDGTLWILAHDERGDIEIQEGIAFAESEQYLARQQPRREVVIEFRHVEIRRRGGRSDTQIVLELAIRLGMRDHGRQDAYGILYDEPNQRFVVTDLTAPSPPAPETAPSGTS